MPSSQWPTLMGSFPFLLLTLFRTLSVLMGQIFTQNRKFRNEDDDFPMQFATIKFAEQISR